MRAQAVCPGGNQGGAGQGGETTSSVQSGKQEFWNPSL